MDKINGHDKDYIDNTPRKFVTVPQPEQDIEIHVHKHVRLKKCLDRDMGTVVDLPIGPCNPCNYIRCDVIAQGISVRRRFVLSYTYIYTLCGPGAARTSIICRRVVSEYGFASERNIAAIIDVDSSCDARKRRTRNQTPGMTCHRLF